MKFGSVTWTRSQPGALAVLPVLLRGQVAAAPGKQRKQLVQEEVLRSPRCTEIKKQKLKPRRRLLSEAVSPDAFLSR